MTLWPFGRREPVPLDVDAFFGDLRRFAPMKDRYTAVDRYRDFRAVFISGGASPEQARRVLWQVLDWCRLFRPVATPGDPHETYRRDGERNIGLKIFMTLNVQPSAGPGGDEPQE